MCKPKSKHAANARNCSLPKAPWLYLNNSTSDVICGNDVANNLISLIPKAVILTNLSAGNVPKVTSPEDTIVVFVDHQLDQSMAIQTADALREKTIELAKNFTSVNLTGNNSTAESANKVDWGTNHLEVNTTQRRAPAAAEKIFKWLFKVLTVPETLHLIPEADMRAVDNENFPDYAYCPINQSHKHRKDAKIQFVALIASKPKVGADKRLQWKVVDRTGEANFFFQWRGADSKATWDWVLKLQPGDRKALPRMPMVHIKEKKRVQVVKAPFRGVAAVVGGAGIAVKGVGRGLCWVGEKVSMGKSGQWVAEADLDKDGKIKGEGKKDRVAAGEEKKEIKIFNEKGEKMWKDEDDTASMTTGSLYDEKVVKEFC